MELQQNTSGQGASAIVPDEIKGWSWGGFLLNWIWAIGNQVWIGLLGLVPCLNVIMMIVLGVKGNEWAWQNRKWESVEQFKKVQGIWVKWGLILLAVSIVLSIIWVVIAAVIGFGTARQMQMSY